MLKKSASGVLASRRGLNVQERTPRLSARCGLAGQPFWAPCGRVLHLSHTRQHSSFCRSVVQKWFFHSLL